MLKIIFLSLLVSSTLCYNILSAEVSEYHNTTQAKAEYAYDVVNKIFYAFEQWFFTITFCEFTYFENRILKYTETYRYGYPVMLLNGCPDGNTTKVKPKINKHGKTAYLVTANDFTMMGSENAVDILTKTGFFKPRSVVIFVINIPVEVDSYFSFLMKTHFQLMWSRSITNSVVILKAGELKMYTYNPFSDEIRDITHVNAVPKLLAQQYYDLCGYTLRLSVFKKIYVSDDPNPVSCKSKLASTVMKKLNASCNPVLPRDGNTVGDLLKNGTATGVTSDLMDSYSDLELSSRILKNSYFGYIDTTYPLVQDELCFLIRKSPKQSTFTTTLQLISVKLLILFMFNVVFFIIISLIIRIIEIKIWSFDDKRTHGETTLDLIKCFIRQTADIKFTGPVFRWTALNIMIYSLIIDCAIDGIIISAISYPRYKPDINTLSELLQTNLTFGIHNRDFTIFNNSLNIDSYEKFKDRIEIVTDHKFKEIIDKRQFQYAILLRRSESEFISRKPSNMKNGRSLFHIVQECPVPCSIVYGLRYGSPYLLRINYILHHLNQGGILQYWAQSDKNTLFQKSTTGLYAGNNRDKKPLSTGTLQEVFIVWIIGLLISAIAFILEVFEKTISTTINKLKKSKNAAKLK